MQQKIIVVIGSELLPTGMRLAGVKESYMVQSAEETEQLLLKLFERNEVGIVVITEGLAKSIKDRRVRYRMENSLDPLVISVPGYNEKMEEDTLRRLILKAVGIDIIQKDGGKK